jgi:hypothetical protein
LLLCTCDAYLIYVMFAWLERNKQIKYVVFGHFAECCTRQRVPLPSAKAKALGKGTNSRHLGTSFAECHGFAECHDHDTRQSSCLCRVSLTLAHGKTAVTVTLAVMATFLCRGSVRHSVLSDRQKTLDKEGFAVNFFGDCRMPSAFGARHSTKRPILVVVATGL